MLCREGLSTSKDAFNGSYVEYATLHVPTNAILDYKSTAPWNQFSTIIGLNAAITSIVLSESLVTLTEGETLIINISPKDADRNLVFWYSSNPCIATIDNTGMVTAIAPRTTTITAIVKDGSGVSASCEVNVTPANDITTSLVEEEMLYIYSTDGQRINELQKGINIVLLKDGSIRKVFQK